MSRHAGGRALAKWKRLIYTQRAFLNERFDPMRSLALVTLLSMLLCGCSDSDDNTAKNDYSDISTIIKLAETGDANAQYQLAVNYWDGLNIDIDYTLAAKWWMKAAEQEYEEAYFPLAWMYEQGLGGLSKDNALAAKWYKKAAESGDGEAQTTLAWMYANGSGVEQSYHQAYVWYSVAAHTFKEKLGSWCQDSNSKVDCKQYATDDPDDLRGFASLTLADAVRNLELLAARLTPEELHEAGQASSDIYKDISKHSK